ncbi:hypothetical protein HPK19_25610 (plasmid) [Arthrobacter citreus]|nr:hypothetical protein HPK19_25610 [Arthrobacter citreus]
MEQLKQNLIKILLIVNLGISMCAAIGVGYVVYKQSTSPDFSKMGTSGGSQTLSGNGQNQSDQDQSSQTQ